VIYVGGARQGDKQENAVKLKKKEGSSKARSARTTQASPSSFTKALCGGTARNSEKLLYGSEPGLLFHYRG
jgi:hypothetical protein